MSDTSIHDQIENLVNEEHQLREQLGRGEISRAEEQERMRTVETQLDRLWDLLRQRQARRDAGQDPANARERSGAVVEDYEG